MISKCQIWRPPLGTELVSLPPSCNHPTTTPTPQRRIRHPPPPDLGSDNHRPDPQHTSCPGMRSSLTSGHLLGLRGPAIERWPHHLVPHLSVWPHLLLVVDWSLYCWLSTRSTRQASSVVARIDASRDGSILDPVPNCCLDRCAMREDERHHHHPPSWPRVLCGRPTSAALARRGGMG
jgi:hypothetical protein